MKTQKNSNFSNALVKVYSLYNCEENFRAVNKN